MNDDQRKLDPLEQELADLLPSALSDDFIDGLEARMRDADHTVSLPTPANHARVRLFWAVSAAALIAAVCMVAWFVNDRRTEPPVARVQKRWQAPHGTNHGNRSTPLSTRP